MNARLVSMLNACGCHQCGGSTARNAALLARRVVAYGPMIYAQRGMNGHALANRHVPIDLYSRLALRVALPRWKD